MPNSIVSNDGPEIGCSNSNDATRLDKGHATTAELELVSLVTDTTQSWRSSFDNPAKRQKIEENKLKDAVSFIKEQLQSGKTSHETLMKYMNYPSCYDIEFLKAMAQQLNIDISGALLKKRVSHKEVLNALISQLLS